MKRLCAYSSVQFFRLLITMCLFASAGMAGKVQTWIEKGVDFSQFKTYQWLPPKLLSKSGVVEDEAGLAPIIKEAVTQQLSRKGLREASNSPDLEVSVFALAESIPQLDAFIFTGSPLDYTTPIGTVGRYNREGTLIVNLIDAKTQKSAWCGMIRESIDNKPGSGRKKIGSATAKLFKKYPKTTEANN
jgi:hypothetical protein